MISQSQATPVPKVDKALGKAKVDLTVAQKLARHSTPTLTSNIYTHLGISDKASAIDSLPAPPSTGGDNNQEPNVLQATGTDDALPEAVSDAAIAPPPAPHGTRTAGHFETQRGSETTQKGGVKEKSQTLKLKRPGTPRVSIRRTRPPIFTTTAYGIGCTAIRTTNSVASSAETGSTNAYPRHAKSRVETSGLEPPTPGLQSRCSPN